MGNCQAIDAAVLVIQHPSGREERLYWPVTVREVMKLNPGHHVSLILPLPISQQPNANEEVQKRLHFTRVKLLRHTDTLALGHAYRLITSQEVIKVLRAKKHAKMKKSNQSEKAERSLPAAAAPEKQTRPERPIPEFHTRTRTSDLETTHQEFKRERHRQRVTTASSAAAARSKSWRPSLNSISEATS